MYNNIYNIYIYIINIQYNNRLNAWEKTCTKFVTGTKKGKSEASQLFVKLDVSAFIIIISSSSSSGLSNFF